MSNLLCPKCGGTLEPYPEFWVLFDAHRQIVTRLKRAAHAEPAYECAEHGIVAESQAIDPDAPLPWWQR